MSSKPTIVVVPGSWHIPEHFEPMSALLRKQGYLVVGVSLPSNCQTGPFSLGVTADAAVVRSTILAEVEAGREVVVLMHSYGGIPGSAGSEGLSKTDREAKGLSGGIIKLIYMSAFVLDKGAALAIASSGKIASWITTYDDPSGQYWFPNDPVGALFHDVPETLAQRSIDMLRYQGLQYIYDEQTYAAWKFIPSTYILLLQDKAIPLAFQEAMSKKEGGLWSYESIDSSHSPFLSKPDETATLVIAICSK